MRVLCAIDDGEVIGLGGLRDNLWQEGEIAYVKVLDWAGAFGLNRPCTEIRLFFEYPLFKKRGVMMVVEACVVPGPA